MAVGLLAGALFAQDTPTEKEAAKDVIRKMADLEKSLNVPGWVSRFTVTNAARDQVVARAKQLMDTELMALSDDITRHPEIGFEETRSVKLLIDCLKRHNFEITENVAKLKTAFVGRYKGNHGAPNLGVILEYDALRGTKGAFHGDQHSAQGPVGIAAAVAIAEYLEKNKLPGSVVVFGTPGEEMMPPVAKTDMFAAGVFDGMDIIVRSHSTSATTRPAPGFGTCCLNIDGVKYTFSGAPAHQMTSWNGRNALEAVIHLFNNIDAVRASMRPETRVQGVITEGGAAPNVVPDRTQADFYIRYPDEVYLKTVREFVDNAAKAAALATGTKVKIDHYGSARDGISLSTLAEVGLAHAKQFGATNVLEAPGKPQGFEETGSVSSAIPGLGFLVDAESMAALLFDFATESEFRTAVKREFTGIKALFGEYQDALKKTYVNPAVPDAK
jgi:amidohydrolase